MKIWQQLKWNPIVPSVLLTLMTFRAWASGIHYDEITLEQVVTNSAYIVQAEYVGEDKDEYGPHTKYIVQNVIHSNIKNTNVNVKVWAAHAKVWGIAMAEAERTGTHLWFTVPEYKGTGREDKPEKGKSYILLLKQLSRETDFDFTAQGALLNTKLLQEITALIRKNKKSGSPASCLCAAPAETVVKLETKTGMLEGSLMIPAVTNKIPVVLIIAGSGPTDRDGNNPAMKNNSLKLLAEALSKNGIASLRYDKRGIGKSQKAGVKEEALRFEHYSADAKAWAEWLKTDKRFHKVVIVGHSEGSLIGMLAAQQKGADQFISIAGVGVSADKLLKEQLKNQPPEILKIALPIIEKLKQGQTVNDVNPMLYTLFRPSVQPYMISWFKVDPALEMAKLKIPVLVIQGTTDIQVSVEHAQILAKANPKAKLTIINGMNHVLKASVAEWTENIATYNQPDVPIKAELVEAITAFVWVTVPDERE